VRRSAAALHLIRTEPAALDHQLCRVRGFVSEADHVDGRRHGAHASRQRLFVDRLSLV